MKARHSLIFLVAILSGQVQAAEVIGKLTKTGDGKLQLLDTVSKKSYVLKMNPQYEKFVESFVGHKTYLKFSGKSEGDVFHGEKTPVIISGPSRITGVLKVIGSEVYVDSKRVTFTKPSKVNGYSFNEASIQSYNNKKVIANGTDNGDTFEISALIPANLFSAAPSQFEVNLGNDPINYVLKSVPKNEISQAQKSFRGTLLGKGQKVKKADYALVITLSGRQGDDLGSVNGHFAAGIAKVNDDLSLDMEVHNYYPPKNEKLIIPGFVDVVDYYGNLTAGQSNYRPTYTMIMYGESYERLLTMRNSMDEEFSKLRLGEDNFSVAHNCTTVSSAGLSTIGLVEKNRTTFVEALSPNHILNKNPFKLDVDEAEHFSDELKATIGKTPTNYFPRPSFDALIRNLGRLTQSKKLGAYRIDYIFQAQTPSDRPVGGTSADEFVESLRFTLESSKHDKSPYTPKEIFEHLNEVD